MFRSPASEEHGQLFKVVLSGGPPWGFTLTGGSEFGSRLCVKKVTDEKKAIHGNLCSGDEILSVNGKNCTSRANAIQMVRAVEDELTLKICRWNNDISRNELPNELEPNHMYTNMVENMNDLSQSTYSLKRKSIQKKHFNNNDNAMNGNYKIISINKKGPSNEHSIRIGIPDNEDIEDEPLDAPTYSERCVDEPVKYKTQSSLQNPQHPQRQKVTVKMVPAAQSRQLATNPQGYFPQEASRIVYPGQDQTDHVASEPLQKVSTARAMFESMSSSNIHQKKQANVKVMRKQSSFSVLDEKPTEKGMSHMPAPAPIPHHGHSRSLPIEMAGKEFEMALAAYKQTKMPAAPGSKTGESRSLQRPKSAHYYESEEAASKQEAPSVPQRYSTSDIMRSFRNKGGYQSASFEQQNVFIPSYSSEDLRNVSKDDIIKGRASSSAKNDSANELRQAANRYHQELMKNYPKFRHSIAMNDTSGKLPRKVSSPAEDAFARGDPHRATIATASNARVPRSYSANDSLEIKGIQDALSKSHDNSMMSRLLRDQNQASLVKIEEESKAASIATESSAVLRRCSTEPEKVLSRSTSTVDSYRVADSKQSTRNDLESSFQRISSKKLDSSMSLDHDYRPYVKTTTNMATTKTYSPSQQHIDKTPVIREQNFIENIRNNKKPVEETPVIQSIRDQPRIEDIEERLKECSVTRYPDQQIIDNVHIETKTNVTLNQNSELNEIPAEERVRSLSNSWDIETDIDSEEAEQIIHRKDPSTDSAVYMMHEPTQLSHFKPLSHESMDNRDEMSRSEQNRPEEEFNNDDYFPPPPDELLQDDEEHESLVEKEKPQRTINRKKKDSNALTSRNNSCVSTDSTTSTTTVDSGIVVRSDSSPRTSPLSSEQYQDLSGSREALDDDVAALNDEPHATSTPERHEQAKEAGYRLLRHGSVESPRNGSADSSGANSRPDSMLGGSPRIEDLDNEKGKLIGSMREKINELRDQEQEISDEIRLNEELGKKVLSMVEAKATQSEFSKFELFIGELNKIVALLLSLTQRLHRYELMLQDLDMSDENDKAKKDMLVSKIDKLKSQHEEACYLRDVNDKRGDNVATFLEKYCTEEEFADFQYYVDMKSQLALMQSEIREKVKLGEERLKALEQTGSEWGFG